MNGFDWMVIAMAVAVPVTAVLLLVLKGGNMRSECCRCGAYASPTSRFCGYCANVARNR